MYHFCRVPLAQPVFCRAKAQTGTGRASGLQRQFRRALRLEVLEPRRVLSALALAGAAPHFASSPHPAAGATGDSIAVLNAWAAYGGTANLSATLTDASSAPIQGVNLVFEINGEYEGDPTTNSSGTASLSAVSLAGLNAGSATITVIETTDPTVVGTAMLTITPIPVSIVAAGATKTYGNPDPAFSVTYIPNSINLGTPVLTTNEPMVGNAPVGTYTITASGLSSRNYDITFVPGTLTVTPQPLTVTVDDKSMVYGAPVPALTYSCVGLAAGDTEDSLAIQPGLSTTATSTSPVGTYPITTTAAYSPNYTISYANAGAGTLTVTPATPAITLVSSVSPAVFSQQIVLTAQVSVPGSGSLAGTVTFSDGGTALGAPVTPDANGVASLPFTFLAGANHQLTAQYSGDPNCNTVSATFSQSVQNAALEPDPLSPGRQALYIGGTSVSEHVSVTQTARRQLAVALAGRNIGVTLYFPNAVSRIVAYCGPANQSVAIANNVTTAAWLLGGPGNDTLVAGGGPSLLMGGGGNDSLQGGNGRAILIGGTGADSLRAGNGDSMLIAGTTDYDTNGQALAAILAEWSRADRPYQTRIADLSGSGVGGLNGSSVLDLSNVHANGAADSLYGGKGMDWFFAASNDKIHSRRTGEILTVIQ